MTETAVYLVEHVLPRVPVRQWVLSLPIPLRTIFAIHPELIAPMLGIVHRAINTHLIKQADIERKDAVSGAITLIQRFGSAANLNTHLHALVLAGVYSTAQEIPVFIEAPAPNAKLRSQVVPTPPQQTTTEEGNRAQQTATPDMGALTQARVRY